MNPNREILINQDTAPVTHLACVARVDQCERPTGTCCLVGRELDQLVPRNVMDTLGEPPAGHFGDVQILETEGPEVFNESVREFMGEVLAPIGGLFMSQRNGLAPETALRRSLVLLAEPALDLRERLFGLLKEAGILDGLARREGGKLGQAHVHADSLGLGWKGRGLNFTREAGKPFT